MKLVLAISILSSPWMISTADAFVAGGGRVGIIINNSNHAVRIPTRIGKTTIPAPPQRLSTTQLRDVSAQEALERTKQRLQQMQQPSSPDSKSSGDPRIDAQVREYLSFPANALKQELKKNGLNNKGRKPDLARRLAEFEYLEDHPDERFGSDGDIGNGEAAQQQPRTRYLEPKGGKDDGDGSSHQPQESSPESQTTTPPRSLDTFCGLELSPMASEALGRANFATPTPIQHEALPFLARGESAVLHAETGSGKTLAYLLPITEALWRDELGEYNDDEDLRYGLILTPTRELAAQVAGVASALAPPGSVRLVTKPTNLMSEGRYWKERRGDRVDDPDLLEKETAERGRGSPPRLFVGSAKALMASLYGDDKMPASPTRKPAARELLSSTRWVVLDEVDRLLNTKTKKGLSTSQRNQRLRNGDDKTGPLHEKPAATLTAAVARRTLGRAQVIAASATVGRSLKRELSRVLGLPPKEHPPVLRGSEYDDGDNNQQLQAIRGQHVDRAVTIPGSVRHFVLPVDDSSTGKLLTSAFFAIKNLNNNSKNNKNEKILLVLTKGCGITTTNAIGALKHFRCKPEPKSLLDVLQDANGTDQLMDVHRDVAGSDGIGADSTSSEGGSDSDVDPGYVLVTGEDTVRGMHLAGLDTVVVVGRANGPDEYVHIAGRTGRAGKPGKVLNVLSEPHQVAAVRAWETLLQTKFGIIRNEDIAGL